MPSRDVVQQTLCLVKELYCDQGLDIPVLKKVVARPEWIVVEGSGGACSQAINFWQDFAGGQEASALFKEMMGEPLDEVASAFIESGGVSSRCAAIAALNALSSRHITPEALASRGFDTSKSIADHIEKDDVVTVIGYGKLVGWIAKACKKLYVTEMRPRMRFQTLVIDADSMGYVPKAIDVRPAEDNREVISASDVVIATASTLANETFEEIFSYAKGARVRGIYGPSGSMVPDVLLGSGLTFTRAFYASDPKRCMQDALGASSFESALKKNQTSYCITG